jgi:ADP-heptose:LPS heptosyltransferase
MLIAIHDYLDWFLHRSVMGYRGWRERCDFKTALPQGPSRILLIRFGSLGDVIRATSVVEALSERYGRVDVLTSEKCAPIFMGNPRVGRILTDASQADCVYDWIVNLQVAEPLGQFVSNYREQLQTLQARFWSGNGYVSNRWRRSYIYNYYCYQEIEELYRVALLSYPKDAPLRVRVYNEGEPVLHSEEGKRIGVFIGTSPGGYDQNYKYLLPQGLRQLVENLKPLGQVVLFGEGESPKISGVVDLVGKTTLMQLIGLFRQLDVVVTTDSSPFHLALALQLPVVGLFAHNRLSILGEKDFPGRVIGLNALSPCAVRSWRWRNYCTGCSAKAYSLYRCNFKDYPNKLSLIEPKVVVEQVAGLLGEASRRMLLSPPYHP